MIWFTVTLAFALVHICVSKSLSKRWDDLSVKHSWTELPHGWELHGPAPANHIMEMRIGLKQAKLDELISVLNQVSDPDHERYGAHLSTEEVQALVAPHPESLELVDSWLTHHDIDFSSAQRSGGNDWITVRVSVAQAESMLGTQYNVYRHTDTTEYVVRTLGYSLPSILHGHIDVVVPTTYFGNFHSMRATNFLEPPVAVDSTIQDAQAAANCSTVVTPSCLRSLYKTDSYIPQATSKNLFGIAGYDGEFANYADLQTFLRKFRTDAVGANFTTAKVHGGGDNQSVPGVEANLDIQYTESLSFPTHNIYYSTGGSPPFKPDSNTLNNTNEPFLDWLNFILNQTTIPQTITTSYGDDEQSVPLDYAKRVCNGFAQLGVKGTSVLFSSGDFGVGTDCHSNDGKNRTQFLPNFPASCPFVTTVGATTGTKEIAAKFSGGGFSNYFATPHYQAEATSAYLKSIGNTNRGLFNKSGRAYPDVSAQGSHFQIVVAGKFGPVGGTSASCPTFASVVSLLNDHLIACGKSPLGFLNPWLYSKGKQGLNDITIGSNPGCSTNGFTATVGWDPVTGLGTPNFIKLKEIVDS